MVEIPGTEADESLAHIERRGGGDPTPPPVMPLAMPMIGWHDKDADAKASEKYFHRQNLVTPMEVGADGRAPIDPYENVRVLIQAKPKLVMQECPLDPDMECEGRHEGLGVSGQPSDLSEEPIPYTLTNRATVADIPTFEDRPVWAKPFTPLEEGGVFGDQLFQVYAEAFNLCLRKHKDYGPLNIARAPGGPLNGLRVRMWDKFARINHLVDNGATPENESLRDSFVDMLNYSAIALMVLDGNWPSE